MKNIKDKYNYMRMKQQIRSNNFRRYNKKRLKINIMNRNYSFKFNIKRN